MSGKFWWLRSQKAIKQQQTADATTAGADPIGPPTTGINQAMNGQDKVHALGQGHMNVTNNTINIDYSKKIVAQLLPFLEQLLSEREDYLPLKQEVARCLDPDLSLSDLQETVVPADRLPLPLQLAETARQRATDPGDRAALGAPANRWAHAVAGQDVLTAFRKSVKPEDDPCLLIVLKPDQTGGAGYSMSLILFQNGHDPAPDLSNDGELRSLDDIRTRLQEILPRLLKGAKPSRLLVEFVVPFELLNTDFDTWSYPERASGQLTVHAKLGHRYPVVVRDLWRVGPDDDGYEGDQENLTLWRDRWDYLRDCAGAVPAAVRWPEEEEKGRHDYSSLSSSLMGEDEEARRAVCLALLSAPAVDAHSAQLLAAGITAGIPAAIWLRRLDDSGNGKKYLVDAVESPGLNRLPYKVHEMRRQAEGDLETATHPGRHLSLLWDDPNRMVSPCLLCVPPPASPNGAD